MLLDGARTGIVAYLRGRGITDPHVGYAHARADGRGIVPAIEQQVGKAIARYPQRVVVRDLVYETIRGEAAALHDPYTVFFTKRELAAFQTALDGETFGGIGVLLALDPATRAPVASRVFDGPAKRAGLQDGDIISAVDGQSTAGLSLDVAGTLLRGKIGTTVRLTVVRAGAPLAQPITIVRASVTPPETTAAMLPADIGYVALRAFGFDAGKEVRDAVGRLDAQGARAIIFDLRDDGGGYESAAVAVASVFLPSGPVVSVQENHGKRRVTDARRDALPARPLVVLVNGNSASGSELVTAAIKDHGAGTIVGTRTFGKGLVQTMIPLPDGSALKVTTARYFTPDGHDINHVGVEPDVVVAEPAGSVMGTPGRDPQLDRALAILAQHTPE